MLQHRIPLLVDGDAIATMIRIPRSSGWSGMLRHEIAPAHQVVGGRTEAKEPVDEATAAVPQFPEERDGLQPTKRLLNELALAVTQTVAGVPRRACVDRTATVAKRVRHDMRRDAHPSHGADPRARIVRLVRSHRDPARR